MKKKYLIVNVDDFGLNPAVTRAVLELSKKGIVTSSTILANSPFFQDFKNIENVGFGIHLNILRGKPINPSCKIDTLVNNNETFLGDYIKLFKKYIKKKIDYKQVETEWDKQIQLLLDSGLKITHLDSEKHIHAWPGLMNIALKLAKKYYIKWVRRPYELLNGYCLNKSNLRIMILRSFALFHRRINEVKWPDITWGIADQGKDLNINRFIKYLNKCRKEKIIEMVVHPGIPFKNDPEIPEDFGKLRVNSGWQDEFDALSNPEWFKVFKDNNINLCNYGQLDL